MSCSAPSVIARAIATASFLICFGIAAPGVPAASQQLDESSVIQHIDAAVKARLDNVIGYTVTEHYAVFRNNDELHPVAEMTVHTVYNVETGKTYTPISQSGSSIIRSQVLGTILDNEQRVNQPGNREASWITSANYQMKLKPGGIQLLDGRECLLLTLAPKRTSPSLFSGTLWIDAKDYSIVQLVGTASKSPSFIAGPAEAMRQYAPVSGFAQATHASAVSNSFLFGRTEVKIDYLDYQVQLRPNK